MASKLSSTWGLMRASWMVLRLDKTLLLFPLLSGICCILVLASFGLPLMITGAWQPPQKGAAALQQVVYYGVLFAFYFVNYFVITFFNVAIVTCAVRSMRGEAASFSEGIRGATARIHVIVGWALLSATVGLVLRAIEERLPKGGAILSGILGMAFTIVSFLVVPILAVENLGPWAAVKESSRLLKKTWGEQLVGNFSFGLIFALLGIPGFIMLVIGGIMVVMAIGQNGGVTAGSLGVILGVAGLVYLLLLSLVNSALRSIFQAALYLYSHDGEVPPAFAGTSLANVLTRA